MKQRQLITLYELSAKFLDMLHVKNAVKDIIKKAKFFGIPKLKPEIVDSIPHNPPFYTQGLYHDGDHLYESTGLYGQSSLKKIDDQNGSIKKIIHIERYFAEGIACINDVLVQLTWKSGTAFVYQIPELVAVGSFSYSGEGWGLTSKKTRYVMTDGSHRLYYRNTKFERIGKLSVYLNKFPLKKINDIQYSKGKYYANVLWQDYIFKICARTGRVEAIFDCSELRNIVDHKKNDSVMNGIAYNHFSNLFYLTGKNWKTIFIVRLD